MPYRQLLHLLNSSLDWWSLKLNALVLPFLFMNPTPFLLWLGAVASLSTIVYNVIRIRETFKKKDN
jgi:hypothetical protein